MAAGNPAQNRFGAANKLNNFLMCPMNALSTAIVSFNAQDLGAGRQDRIRRGTGKSLLIGLAMYLVLGGAGMLLTINGAYQYLFMSADKITAATIHCGNLYLYVDLSMYFALMILLVFRLGVQGVGHAEFALAAGCADWEVTEDPLGELSDFYQNENEEPEPEPLTAFTLPYIAGGTLDPVRTTDTMQQTVESLMYQGLFALDEQFRPQAVLADSWTYDSAQRTWTIRIKADAAFSDGSAVTAADVAATLERARTSERYAARLRDVTSVYVREDAVVVALSSSLATLPSRLDIPIIKAGTENRTAPTGSGPYLFAKDDTGAYLTANSRWWQDSSVLPLSTIRLQHCKDKDSALYAFTSREVQLLTLDLTGSNSTGVSGAGDYAEAATPVMQFLGMNTRREALSDPALRRALSAGIDRETLVSSCLLGQGTAAQLPASPAYAGYDTALETPYDTAAYNRLLNAAFGEQAEDETPLTLTLLVNEESSFKVSAAQEIAMYLNTARLTVTVEAVPWDTFLARLESGDFDLYYGECRLTADWDLTALLSTEGSLNYGGWSDETTDRLLQAYRSNGADANLVALWQQLLDTAPFAPICFKSVSVVTTEGVVQGLSPTETAPLSPLGGWSVRLDA